MKEHIIAAKFINKSNAIYLICALVLIVTNIFVLFFEFSFMRVIILGCGIFFLFEWKRFKDNTIYKVSLDNENMSLSSKKQTYLLKYSDITRIAFRRRLFKSKELTELQIYTNNCHKYKPYFIDINISDFSELLNGIVLKCNHLGEENTKGILLTYSTAFNK
jgi:hypothetical protein